MNSQQLLFINFIIFGLLVFYFLIGRSKHKQRAVLDLKKSQTDRVEAKSQPNQFKEAQNESQAQVDKADNELTEPKEVAQLAHEVTTQLEPDIKIEIKTEIELKSLDVLISKEEPLLETPINDENKNTNIKQLKSNNSDKKLQKEIVYFMYNGHEWEAHEVLGLKAGVTLEEATAHYQNLIKRSDPSTFEFYEAAFSAILKLKSPRW